MIRVTITIFLLLLIIILAVALFLNQPQFGKLSTGKRLERIQASSHYKEGKFQNQSFTPQLTGDANYFTVLRKFFFQKSKRNKPDSTLPSMKTDIKQWNPSENKMVWFGHSSYFLQIDGKKILVDPVFSGSASPIKLTTRSFKGSDVYTVDDLPDIDYLFISHDHWDHLDYETILKLKPKVKKVITGLGTGAHLEYWGYNANIIEERDWNEQILLDDGFIVNTLPARHFSGRGLTANQSIWMSFLLTTPSMKIYIGGDSGFDTHFDSIGKQFGPIDLAILECGQYNEYWKYIHMMPEELITAASQLGAKRLIPIHWGKFSLALHDWDGPIKEMTSLSKQHHVNLVTPMIGQDINLDGSTVTSEWWEGIQ